MCELRLDSPSAVAGAEISISSSSASLKTARAVVLRAGQLRAHFEVAASPDAGYESVTLAAGLGDTAVQADLALSPSPQPPLDAPRAIHADSTIDVGSAFPAISHLRSYATASGTRVCSPGAPAAIMGRLLSPSAVPVFNPTADSTELGSVRVRIGGDYARLLSVSAERVDFICPIAPAGTTLQVSVETPAGRSGTASLLMSASAPGILTVSGDGAGQAMAFREGASDLAAIPSPELNGAPAAAGDTLSVLVTGIGCDSTTPAPTPLLRFGDQYALAKSVTALSTHAGICRVDVEVPAGIPSGRTPVALELPGTEGNLLSNTASIAIER